MSFVLKLYRDKLCKVIRAKPPDEEVSWMYMWGGRCYHMSERGCDKNNKENILIRHSRHIEQLKNNGRIPTGDIQLLPKWGIDYVELLNNYISETNHENDSGAGNAPISNIADSQNFKFRGSHGRAFNDRISRQSAGSL